MSRFLSRTFVAGCIVTMTASWCRAGEMKSELDCGANPALLRSHFGFYPSGAKAVKITDKGLRFYLTTDTKKPVQTGLYSYFAIAGDFEISAWFDWTPVEVPKDGYGVSCGIAFDTDTRTVALARGNFPGQGGGYRITTKEPKKDYENEDFKSLAKRGRLVLRRVKKELIILSADGDGELNELKRINPFPTETVRKVRLFADPGNAPTSMDARLSKIQFRAEEITGQIPISESSTWGWWLAAGLLMIFAMVAVVGVYRLRTGHWWFNREE
jgi:hypothetical protein